MSRAIDAAVVVLAAALGGWLHGRVAPAPAAPAPVRAVAPRRATPPRVVCRAASVADAPADEACAAAQVRLDTCEARLLAASRARPTTAPSEAVGLDDASAWGAALPRMLADCGITASPVSTDCTEYPCVTGLRASEADAARLESLGNGECGSAGLAADEAPVTTPLRVTCPDGSEETVWMVSTLDPDTLKQLYPGEGFPFPAEWLLLASRRTEALAHAWTCSPDPTATDGG